jgi:hypothetical protein
MLADKHCPGSPTRSLWSEIPVYRAFCILLENLIKIPLNKKALRKKRRAMFPKSRVPSKGAFLHSSFTVPGI